MKRTILILSIVFYCSVSFASEVVKSDAEYIARQWMTKITGEDCAGNVQVTPCFLDSVCTHFVVAFEPRGWVIVAASDLIDPILGYSEESNLNRDSQPISFNQWMASLSEQIIQILKKGGSASLEISEKWADLRRNLPFVKSAAEENSPLLKTEWSQGILFNEMCPVDVASEAGNDHVWTGCAATAMAQVMKYWEYPEHGFGNISYDHPIYGTLSADFENTSYQWNEMEDSPANSNSEIQRLIYHAAVSVKMNFGASSSGSLITETPGAMERHFGYNSSSFWTNSSCWDKDEWKQLLYNEIDRGRPILYMGYSQQSRVSHVFVLDGYKDDYFHFNWGWGGSANGYYLLSLLNPLAHNYSFDQAAILGIVPSFASSLEYPYSEGFEKESDAVEFAGVVSYTAQNAHTGNQSLLLGRDGLSSSSKNSATLIFKVPANASVNFWVKRNSVHGKYNNNQSAVLLTQYGEQVIHEFFCGDFTDDDWINYQFDLSDYFGQTLKLFFSEEMEIGAHSQYMYIDDISIVSTNQNLPPFVPSQPFPSDKSTSVPLNSFLKWTGGDPNSDTISYQVYFSKTYPPKFYQATDTTFVSVELENNTKYYWQVKASDKEEVSASPIWSFTSAGAVPVLATRISSVTKTSANIVGEIVASNNARISERGICLDTKPNPTWARNRKVGTVSAEFNCSIDGLLPYTVYYTRSYAFSDFGVAYGNCVRFHTGADLPKISNGKASIISKYVARVSACVDEIMDTTILLRGVAWSETPDFDTNLAHVVTQQGVWPNAGTFEMEIDKLPGAGTYYYRVFVENSAGRAYTDEQSFTTQNMPPIVNLDTDGSSSVDGKKYVGIAVEQQNTSLVDSDFRILDPDSDPIRSLSFKLTDSEPNVEYLICLTDDPTLVIEGNKTNHLVVSSTTDLNDSIWRNVLGNTYLYNESEYPDVSLSRQIEIEAFDGELKNDPAIAVLTMRSVNDAPECTANPSLLQNSAEEGTLLEVEAGMWNDVRDGCGNMYSSSYRWQTKTLEYAFEEDTITIENESSATLTVDKRFCGKWIRAVERVEDIGCHDDEPVFAEAYTQWIKVEQKEQEIEGATDLQMTFGDDPIMLSASSTLGLPITYYVENENIAEIKNAMLYINHGGSTNIEVRQNGDDCHAPALTQTINLTVGKADQEITFNMPDTIFADQIEVPIDVKTSSNLPLSSSSSNTEVASVCGFNLCINSEGSFSLEVCQKGNEDYNSIEVSKKMLVLWPLAFEKSKEIELTLFPNPASMYVNILGNHAFIEGASLKIFSVTGQLILEKNYLQKDVPVLLPAIPDGIYMVQLKNGNELYWKKLLIEK